MNLKSTLAISTLAAGLACAGLAEATVVIDGYNVDKTPGYTIPRPPCCVWVPDNIGWYWTPKTDMYLANIQTKLADIDIGYDNNFDMTISLFTERPAAGGTKIDAFTFNASSFIDGDGFNTFPWRGTGFADPVLVAAGTTYFVGFQGWAAVYVPFVKGGGINWLASDAAFTQPADAQILSAAYFEEGFKTRIGTDNMIAAAPVIRFIGDTAAPVPEPATLGMMALGLAALCCLQARRKPA